MILSKYILKRIAILLGCIASPTLLLAEEEIIFNYDVLPILSDACFHCHGPDENTRKADLRLDTEEGLFATLDNKPVIARGKPEESLLYQRIISSKPDEQMPPPESHRQLSEQEKVIIRKWIEQGANWSKHWAFEPIVMPKLPKVSSSWIKNPVDSFVLEKLQEKELEPSPMADDQTLLRRVSLDLTGLPPTKQVTEAFLKKSSTDKDQAYEELVDTLFASPSFGERMATVWMAVSRYSDTDGYQLDQVRTQYPWRDWVTRAYNTNMPYDQFVIEQTAGDLLPNATQDQIIATGFNRNHMLNGEGGVDPDETRIEVVADRVEATGIAFLGLTMSCARCHDHKFDPISQEDYFSFFAYFDNIDETGEAGHLGRPFLTLDVSPEHRKQVEAFQAHTKHHLIKFPEGNKIQVAVLKERKGEPRKTFILDRGAWDQPTREVTPSPPTFFPAIEGLAQNRLGLAQWMTHPTNPLTARVAVNRFWELFFGRGIVKTQEDFGVQSARPSHPELLDWLAATFRDRGWDVKDTLKTIVMSSTYRQSSIRDSESHKLDPNNALLSRGSRFRHPSWMIRDQALFAAGLINLEPYGPSVRPYQPENIWFTPTSGKIRYVRQQGDHLYRKSLYTFWRRTTGPANMFDASPRRVCEVNTRRTNTPLHALVTLNDVTFVEAARVLAQKVYSTDSITQSFDKAFQRVLHRAPFEDELNELKLHYDDAFAHYSSNPDDVASLLSFGDSPASSDNQIAIAALTNVVLLILNTDEALSHQ